MTAWGRSRRAALGLGSGMALLGMAACSSPPAKIPAATPTPSSAPTSIAPGVSVSPAELALPPYSVSISNPLPAGVSATRVVRDVVLDNLIENAALMRREAGLLKYSDVGNLLTSEQQEITADVSANVQVLRVADTITSVQVGSKADPNNPAAQIATIVQGTETRTQRTGVLRSVSSTRRFQVLLWVVWAPAEHRYLLCDSADA